MPVRSAPRRPPQRRAVEPLAVPHEQVLRPSPRSDAAGAAAGTDAGRRARRLRGRTAPCRARRRRRGSGAPATRARPLSTSGSRSTGRNRNGVSGSDSGATCSGTPSRAASAAHVAVVPVDQLDHAGRLAERADALLDAVALDRIGQPDAAVDGERVRRAPHRAVSSSRSRRPARRRSGRSRRLLQPGERVLEGLVRLRAEHEQPAVEQEGGDRVGSDRSRLAGRVLDPVAVAVVRRAPPRRPPSGSSSSRARPRSTSGSPMSCASLQYASISRSCTAACRPRSRASSVSCCARNEFGTTSGFGL